MKVTVAVEGKHIRNGVKGKPESCPIALALNDKGYFRSEVARSWARFHDNEHQWYFAYLSPAGTKFVRAFDMGEKVSPFKETISVHAVELLNDGLYDK